jgi:hypothetical protein
MAAIILFKVITAPVLIVALTLLIRRFGPVVGGLAMGVPLVTGPISVFTAIEQGAAFARHAAIGNLVGQVSTCVFCFAYARSATRLGTWLSTLCGITAFIAATVVWNLMDWTLPSAMVLLIIGLGLLILIMPTTQQNAGVRMSPWWDLPLRMIVASGFVLAITSITGHLGPQLSGLIAPFPVFVLILAVFTHANYGGDAVAAMMRGVVIGSLSFGAFFSVVAVGLMRYSVPATYSVAILASIATSGAVYALLSGKLGLSHS